MMKIKRSEYIAISKSIIRKLYSCGCWGEGSLYEDNLKDGFPPEERGKIVDVANALVRQGILCKKSKKYGLKYFLNTERREKINEILGIKEGLM